MHWETKISLKLKLQILVYEEKARNDDLTLLHHLKKWEKIFIWTYHFLNSSLSCSSASWFWTLLEVSVLIVLQTYQYNKYIAKQNIIRKKKNNLFLETVNTKYCTFPFRSSSKCSWIHWVLANPMKVWSRISSWRALYITILTLLCTLNINNLIAGQGTHRYSKFEPNHRTVCLEFLMVWWTHR